jgi:hypothetical protein
LAVYPIPAPNGSDVIIYGHDRGLKVLWRGGKMRREHKNRQPATSKTNGAHHGVITIDSDDDEPQQSNGAHDSGADYEDIDEEEDPDCAYPPIVQELDLNHNSAVTHIAVPATNPAAAFQLPQYAQTHLIVAYATADSTICVRAIPLKPPTNAEKEAHMIEIDEVLVGDGWSNVSSIDVRITSRQESQRGCHLHVAAGGSNMALWHVAIGGDGGSSARQLVQTPELTSKVAFPYSRSHDQLLLSTRSGAVRIYEPNMTIDERPASKDSTSSQPPNTPSGRWLMSYLTPFHTSSGGSASARRKNVLDIAWVLSGRAILVLLEDGEWGLWDTQATSLSVVTLDHLLPLLSLPRL